MAARKSIKRVAIIGGGLAGTACAYMLGLHNIESVIYEAGPGLAPGASGNALGLYNPRFSAQRTAESDYYTAAFALALRHFPALGNVGWSRCGSLHLILDEKKETRFPQTLKNWGWDSDHMRIVNAKEASGVAGVELKHDALYLPDAGVISPEKLCSAYAQQTETQFDQKIISLAALKEDAVILACGMGVKNFEATKDLPLNAVRGQITYVAATEATRALKTNLCYGGYFSPAIDGVHALGATFQRWLDHTALLAADDLENMEGLAAAAPGLAGDLNIVHSRAALRSCAADHFPVAGAVPGHENLYISAGHGSHGVISTLAAAGLIADHLTGGSFSLSKQCIERLSPARFR